MTTEIQETPQKSFLPVRFKNSNTFGLAIERIVDELPDCEFKQLFYNLSFKLVSLSVISSRNQSLDNGEDEISFRGFRLQFEHFKKDIVILNDEEARSLSEFHLHFLSDAIASGNPLNYFDQETYDKLMAVIERDHTTIPIEESYPLVQRAGVDYFYMLSGPLHHIVNYFTNYSISPYSFMTVTFNPHRGHYYPAMAYPALGIEIDVENLGKTISDIFKDVEAELWNLDVRNRAKIYGTFDKVFEEIHYEINYLLTEKLRPSPVLSYENKVVVRRDRSKLWAKVSEPNSPLTEAYLVEAARFVSSILLTAAMALGNLVDIPVPRFHGLKAAMALGNLVDIPVPRFHGLNWLRDKEKGFARPMEKGSVIYETLVSIVRNNREYITHNDNIDSVVDAMAYTIKRHIDELIEKECSRRL